MTVAVIQARMGSTRLPGKVLMDIGGRTMLEMVVTRVKRASKIQNRVVATTDKRADDAVVRECERLGVPYYRGSEDDVLDRYYQTASHARAKTVVRITSDCPLIDPGLIDETADAFEKSGADYAGNTLELTFPRGLDVEVFSFRALEKAWKEAKEPYERVHVTPYIYRHPEKFKLHAVKNPVNQSGYRWTVDTPEDLELVREIVRQLGPFTGWKDILAFVEKHPELKEINEHVRQKKLEDR